MARLVDVVDDGTVNISSNISGVTKGFDPLWGAMPYTVCRDILNDLTGGSNFARRALERGDARLSEIPKDLLSPESRDASRMADDVRAEVSVRACWPNGQSKVPSLARTCLGLPHLRPTLTIALVVRMLLVLAIEDAP